VGTFYRAPQPGAPAFVEEGDVVDEGQTVGIVEAMKLMNEVKADRGGTIAAFAATDGDWVEFEQPLVYLEPAEE
jgi:acetyl-CoA carboxylase biotin carboxyl carrier protein